MIEGGKEGETKVLCKDRCKQLGLFHVEERLASFKESIL